MKTRSFEQLNRTEAVALVERAINYKHQAKESFSLYQITLELRKQNPTKDIRHDITRRVGHNKLVGGAFGEAAPFSEDYRVEQHTALDGRPYLFFVYDEDHKATAQQLMEEAVRVMSILHTEGKAFSMGDAFSIAQQRYIDIDRAKFEASFKAALDYRWSLDERTGLYTFRPDGESQVDEDNTKTLSLKGFLDFLFEEEDEEDDYEF